MSIPPSALTSSPLALAFSAVINATTIADPLVPRFPGDSARQVSVQGLQVQSRDSRGAVDGVYVCLHALICEEKLGGLSEPLD